VSDRPKYRPPTPDEIAADLAAIGTPVERPHAGTDPWPSGERHDTTTCTTCGPTMASPPWQRGASWASVRHDVLPMSSSSDARPGRDGYDLEATS